MLTHYQLVSSNAGTAAGQSTVLPVRSGKIKLVVFRAWVLAAAGGSGACSWELGYNQGTQVFAEAQNPQRTVAVAAHTVGWITASQYHGMPPLVVPSDWDIKVGDQICINSIFIGTAPTNLRLLIDVFIQE